VYGLENVIFAVNLVMSRLFENMICKWVTLLGHIGYKHRKFIEVLTKCNIVPLDLDF